ncbi:MBL fold metallo-hydrolase [Ancylobacter pratisalsi]|uniref:MBL fold metallo-hydrolase n=1 Tax=Ancylobacter pratisalsi TaxID=1745854 RepID=A0A6P1YKA4_9HYPH|nr:MBL fold metallo-hydrolase [Ancylobacter pratisalsi]QIB33111.1 MBL fold metallo-hydrolase [Ancylobacter pratisalsi]
MTTKHADAPSGHFPRVLSPSLLWTGGCLDILYHDRVVHSHVCTYLVRGSDKTLLVDTGNAADWVRVEKDVERFLDGRPLDYIFPTHGELPHCGLFQQWMRKYPEAIAVGKLRDFLLYYPEFAGRMRHVDVGDAVDLGDRRIVFVPPVWRDLKDTLWAFDTAERTLFVSDAFAYLHYHEDNHCDFLTSEQPLPDLRMIQFFNERAMYWTRHTDPVHSYADIDEMLRELRPQLIATAHGGVVDVCEDMLPLVKQGMSVRGLQLAEETR